MILIAAIVAVAAVVFFQYRYFKKHSFEDIRYSAYFSSSEVTAGDYVYLYEELSNVGKIPVTYLKADTEMPEGLSFLLFEDGDSTDRRPALQEPSGIKKSAGAKKERDIGKRKFSYAGNVQSLFVIRPGVKIRRRWRIYCKTRGEYTLRGVLLTQGDVFGISLNSRRIEPDNNRRSVLTVLPRPESLADNYTSSRYLCGDIVTNVCPVTDPVRICGSREYTVNDPMNRVNWKSTAVHGKLMVNIEEKTVRHRFTVLFNMNSKEIEQNPEVPSDLGAIEKCITVCASVLERMAAEDVPVTLMANLPVSQENGTEPLADGDTGAQISVTGPFRGRNDMIFALRALAKWKPRISVPAEKMFDYLVANPNLCTQNENLVVISSYLDRRMLNLHDILARSGVNVSFYITTSRNLIGEIPSDTDVYFAV